MSKIELELDEGDAMRYASASEEDRALSVKRAREALSEELRSRAVRRFEVAFEALQSDVERQPVSRSEYNELMREMGAEGLVESEIEWASLGGHDG